MKVYQLTQTDIVNLFTHYHTQIKAIIEKYYSPVELYELQLKRF